MKILILGANKEHNLEYLYAKYLNAIDDVTCEIYPSFEKYAEIIKKNIFNKIVNRLSVNLLLRSLNLDIIDFVKLNKPEIIWVFKGMEIMPKTIIELKKLGFILVNYNPDHPFIFTGPGSGNKNVTKSIKIYDLHISYNLNVIERFKLEYGIKCEFLPFGFEMFSNEIEILNVNSYDKSIVCFIGNPDKQRLETLNKLADNGVKIDVYGHGWSKIINNVNLKAYEAVYGDEFASTITKYRIQLNLLRIHNKNSHNMRSFEIQALGGIQLTENTREHKLFFEENSNIFLYNNLNECKELIQKILSLSRKDIIEMRIKSIMSSKENQFSYLYRAKRVHQIFAEYLNLN